LRVGAIRPPRPLGAPARRHSQRGPQVRPARGARALRASIPMPDALRWQRVKDLFQTALSRAPETRQRFLEDACGGDADLKREIESLLDAQREAGGFLSQSVFPLLAFDGAELQGQRFGPYRILGKVGQGGMGTGYRAVRDDDVFSKTVALKPRPGGAGDEQIRRFTLERQILARFQHPNIATILDGGTGDEGQPYLVMEYVEGEPIDVYCSGRNLGLRERLSLFRTVCGAVHYAHQN